jgi:hypothetical protein
LADIDVGTICTDVVAIVADLYADRPIGRG